MHDPTVGKDRLQTRRKSLSPVAGHELLGITSLAGIGYLDRLSTSTLVPAVDKDSTASPHRGHQLTGGQVRVVGWGGACSQMQMGRRRPMRVTVG